ncbi:MAG: EutN/CcmL family microcompartment protein [Myxococcota bacterium]|nr:EutN/CcmL family microcompartment protein [Myxococcota bacterium]
MILGRVIGNVVSSAKHESYIGHKILIVQPIDEDGASSGKPFLAVDNAQAGEGDTVLVLKEGNGVRQILQASTPPPILELIVGIVDTVEVSG